MRRSEHIGPALTDGQQERLPHGAHPGPVTLADVSFVFQERHVAMF